MGKGPRGGGEEFFWAEPRDKWMMVNGDHPWGMVLVPIIHLSGAPNLLKGGSPDSPVHLSFSHRKMLQVRMVWYDVGLRMVRCRSTEVQIVYLVTNQVFSYTYFSQGLNLSKMSPSKVGLMKSKEKGWGRGSHAYLGHCLALSYLCSQCQFFFLFFVTPPLSY